MAVKADVTLPKIISSNMILQREKPVVIWGTASAGEKVTVSFNGQTKSAVSEDEGRWQVVLSPMATLNKPSVMTIKGSNTLTLQNILVGEVWLCSGQSNMEYTMMKQSKYAQALRSKGLDSAGLAIERNSSIRLFLVKRDLTKPDGGNVNKGWNEAEGETLRAFSAAGYFFARKLQKELGVPIGMIASSVSGSAIEPWMSGAIQQDSSNMPLFIDEAKPGKFYAGMIKPLAPFTVRGFLWYQGETNCFLKETTSYTFKFKHLINSWRKLWSEPDAPFYFVQIAPFQYSKSKGSKIALNETDLPAFRQAQAAALALPHTGMIVTTDLVDNTTDIHPTYKWEIGRRLALLALALDYKKRIEFSGPEAKRITAVSDVVESTFSHIGDGLISSDGKALTSFELAGSDGVFHPANAEIDGVIVRLRSPLVASPQRVRFGWNETAQPNFFNKDGLPAVPFDLSIATQPVVTNKKN